MQLGNTLRPVRVLIADEIRYAVEYVQRLATHADVIDIVGLSRHAESLWEEIRLRTPDVLLLSEGFGALDLAVVQAGLKSVAPLAKLVVLTRGDVTTDLSHADAAVPGAAPPEMLVNALLGVVQEPGTPEVIPEVQPETEPSWAPEPAEEALGQTEQGYQWQMETPEPYAEPAPLVQPPAAPEMPPPAPLEPYYEPSPLTMAPVQAAPEPIQPVRPRRIRSRSRAKAETFIVFSGKGGVGKSLIATNLAVALSQDGKSKVAIIDLNLQFGDVAVLMHAENHPTSIETLAEQGEMVDADTVEEVMATGPEEVRILMAPASPEYADLITTANLRAILREMSKTFDYIIVDSPAHLEERTLEVIEMADQIIVVTSFSITAVKDTKIMLKLLQSIGVPKERITIVLNQTRAKVNFPRSDVEESLRFEVLTQLPYEPKIEESIDNGQPIILSDPKSDFVKQFRKLVDFLAPSAEGEEPPTFIMSEKGGGKANRRRFSLGRS